ncbi:hypothetical protein [Streptomyces sp. NPDC002580]|uniref:hypothetical protein n=1 Tax=Streptomyces sp. NPDC002580 TaxID=3364653 RepID=UPI003681B079
MDMWKTRTCLVVGALLVSVTSCSGSTEPGGPAPASPSARTASPERATVNEKGVDAARKALFSEPSTMGRNAPDAQGPLLAASNRRAALFVWETRDGRFCHGFSNGGGASVVGCDTNPRKVGENPRLVSLLTTATIGWNVVFGAEHELADSVTCNGVAVDVRRVGVMADGQRTIYAVEFPDLTSGTVDVRVIRGKATAEEQVKLLPGTDTDTDADVLRCGS